MARMGGKQGLPVFIRVNPCSSAAPFLLAFFVFFVAPALVAAPPRWVSSVALLLSSILPVERCFTFGGMLL
jgi:hypothetical protein